MLGNCHMGKYIRFKIRFFNRGWETDPYMHVVEDPYMDLNGDGSEVNACFCNKDELRENFPNNFVNNNHFDFFLKKNTRCNGARNTKAIWWSLSLMVEISASL